MTQERTFTNADDARLSAAIKAAKAVLIFVAPGVTNAVADALVSVINRPDRPARLSVVLDVDPEVCRLGYGTIDGLKKVRGALTAHGLILQQQQGLRIGLVYSDATVLFFSPTPLLVEAGSKAPEKPNAIVLSLDTAGEAIVQSVADASPEAPPPEDPTAIGQDAVNDKELAATEKDLAENPVKEFNLARLERVFNYALQFVEFKVLNYKLSSKNVHLEPEWLGLDDKDLTRRITNQFRLFDRSDAFRVKIPLLDADARIVRGEDGRIQSEEIGEDTINRTAKRLRDYLVVVSDYGSVIAKKRKPDFEKEVQVFRKQMEFYKRQVRRHLAKRIEGIKKRLIQELMPGLVEKPPRGWLRGTLDGKLSKELAEAKLSDALEKVFSLTGEGVDPKVLVVYKDVTYTTIQDSDFQEKLEKVYGEDAVQSLLDEYDAARGRDTDACEGNVAEEEAH